MALPSTASTMRDDVQKALLVTTGPEGTRGLTDLNDHLRQGWRVAQTAPMGGGGATEGFAALVVHKRSGQAELALDELEGEIEEALEGDGGLDVDVPEEPGLGRLGPGEAE